MHQRRGREDPKEGGPTADGAGAKDAATTADPSPPVQLRAPRHGGWKGFRGEGREAQMLRGEPGYHLGGCSKESSVQGLRCFGQVDVVQRKWDTACLDIYIQRRGREQPRDPFLGRREPPLRSLLVQQYCCSHALAAVTLVLAQQ